ncbi:MAG: LON peptidase substrate-binding domain-containing protein, partial [Desulfohalobium sp.]
MNTSDVYIVDPETGQWAASEDDSQGGVAHAVIQKNDSDDEHTLDEIPDTLPLLAVRDIVVFNYMILPLFVGRDKSVKSVEASLNDSRYIFIATQRDEKNDDPGPDDLYEIGTVGLIMRMLKMPDGRLKVLVQGVSRAKIKQFTQYEPHHQVEIELIPEAATPEITPDVEALMRSAR